MSERQAEPCWVEHGAMEREDWAKVARPIRHLYVTAEAYHRGDHLTRDICTLSPYPDCLGWETDCGTPGYGLPFEVAVEIAELFNRAALVASVVESALAGSVQALPVPSEFAACLPKEPEE